MKKSVEFLFDYGSATSYLAYHQLPKVAARVGAEVIYRPILLGAIFKSVGTHSPVENPTKARWMLGDLQNFARRYGVPFRHNPHFPVNTMALLRGALAAQERDEFKAYSDAVMTGMWCDARNMGEMDEVAAVLTEAGLDPYAYATAIQQDHIKQALKDNTDSAVARGVFGAPSFFVNDQMFFGQDRLDFVEEALAN